MPMATKEAQREYQRNWMRRRREEFFADKQCVKCGSIEKLELDHKDPAKKVSHAIWSWSKERREAEVAKCQVLCHDCHLRKSATEKATGECHGKTNLRDSEIAEIRRKVAEGTTRSTIQKEYNLPKSTVRDIVLGRTRKLNQAV